MPGLNPFGDFSSPVLIALPFVVLFAYTIYGATGFGSSVIAVPILAHWLPLAFVVPLITLIDLAATTQVNFRQWRNADLVEFRRLIPTGLIGIVIGVTLLVNLPPEPALLSLGVFIAAYGLYLLVGRGRRAHGSRHWAWPAGFFGGVFSALFGTGGPIYVSYLSARLEGKAALRATASLMVGFSVVLRTAAFAVSGILLDSKLLLASAVLLPVMLIGLWLGNRLHDRLTRGGLLKVIAILLCGNGVLLAVRAIEAISGRS
jgi:uncharacterized membrane protein YfcA